MYGVMANYVCLSNFQLCYSPSTYLPTSVLVVRAGTLVVCVVSNRSIVCWLKWSSYPTQIFYHQGQILCNLTQDFPSSCTNYDPFSFSHAHPCTHKQCFPCKKEMLMIVTTSFELYPIIVTHTSTYPHTVSSSREMAGLLQYLLKVHHQSTMCHAPR